MPYTPYSIEAAVIGWLQTNGYSAAQLMQDGRTGVFVTVERTGGGVENFVDYPELAVQVWADTPAQAEAAAQDIRLLFLIGAPPAGVHSFSVNSGAYPFFDPDTDRPRYQLTIGAACQLVE